MEEMGYQIIHFGDIVFFFCPAVDEDMKFARSMQVPLKEIVVVTVPGSSENLVYRLVGAVETLSEGRDAGHHVAWPLDKDGSWYRVDDRTMAERRSGPSKFFSLVAYERVFQPSGFLPSSADICVARGLHDKAKAIEELLRQNRPTSTMHLAFSNDMLLGFAQAKGANGQKPQVTWAQMVTGAWSLHSVQRSNDDGASPITGRPNQQSRETTGPRAKEVRRTADADDDALDGADDYCRDTNEMSSPLSNPEPDAEGWTTIRKKGAARRRKSSSPRVETASSSTGQLSPKPRENRGPRRARTATTNDHGPSLTKATERNTLDEVAPDTSRQETTGDSPRERILSLSQAGQGDQREESDKIDVEVLTDDSSTADAILCGEVAGISFTSHDMASARPGQYLNDVVLEIGMRSKLLSLDGLELAKVHLIHSWLLARLWEKITAKSDLLKDASYGKDSAKKLWDEAWRIYDCCGYGTSDWKTVDIFSKEFLIFPVHAGNHWSVVFVRFVHLDDDEAPAATIFLSDSLTSIHKPNHIARLVRFFLNLAWHVRKTLSAAGNQRSRRTNSVRSSRVSLTYSNRNCPEILLQTPMQHDGFNCGVHSILAVGRFVEYYAMKRMAGDKEGLLEESFKSWKLDYGAADVYRLKLLQQLEERITKKDQKMMSRPSHLQSKSPNINDSVSSSKLSASSKPCVSNEAIINDSNPVVQDAELENIDESSLVDILLSLNTGVNSSSQSPNKQEEQDDASSTAISSSSQGEAESRMESRIGFKSVQSSLSMRSEASANEIVSSDLPWLPRELSSPNYPPSLVPLSDTTESERFYVLRESVESLPGESFGDCIMTLLTDYFAWFAELGLKNARSISIMIADTLESRVLHTGRKYSTVAKNCSKHREGFGHFPIVLGCVCREYAKKKLLGGKKQRARLSSKCGCKTKVKIGFGVFEISHVEHICPRFPFGDRGHASNRNLFRVHKMSQESEDAFYSMLNQCVRTNGDDFNIFKKRILETFPEATDKQISQLVSSTRSRFRFRKSPRVLHGLLATEIENIQGHILYDPSPDNKTQLLAAAFWMHPKWPSPSAFHMFFIDGTSKVIGHDLTMVWILGLSQEYTLQTVAVMLCFEEASRYLDMAFSRMQIRDPSLFTSRHTVWMSDDGTGISAALHGRQTMGKSEPGNLEQESITVVSHIKCGVHKTANFFRVVSGEKKAHKTENSDLDKRRRAEFLNKVEVARLLLSRLEFDYKEIGGVRPDEKDNRTLFAEWGNCFPKPDWKGNENTTLKAFLYLRASWCWEVFLLRLHEFGSGSSQRMRLAVEAAFEPPDWALCCRRLTMDLGFGTNNIVEGNISVLKRGMKPNLSAPEWFHEFNNFAFRMNINARDHFSGRFGETPLHTLQRQHLSNFRVMIEHLDNAFVIRAAQHRVLDEANKARGCPRVQRLTVLYREDIKDIVMYSFFGIYFVRLALNRGVRYLPYKLFEVQDASDGGRIRRFFVLVLNQGSYVCSCGYTIQNGGLYCRHVFAAWERGLILFHARRHLHPFHIRPGLNNRYPDFSKSRTHGQNILLGSVEMPGGHLLHFGTNPEPCVEVQVEATWNPFERFPDIIDGFPCTMTSIESLLTEQPENEFVPPPGFNSGIERPEEESMPPPDTRNGLIDNVDKESMPAPGARNGLIDNVAEVRSTHDGGDIVEQASTTVQLSSRAGRETMSPTAGPDLGKEDIHMQSNLVAGLEAVLETVGNLDSLEDDDELQGLVTLLRSRLSNSKQGHSAEGDAILGSAVKRVKIGEQSHDADVSELDLAEKVSAEVSSTASCDIVNDRSVDMLTQFQSLTEKLDGEGLKKIGRLIQSRILKIGPLRGRVTANRLQQLVRSMGSSQRTELESLLLQLEKGSPGAYNYQDLKTFVLGSLPGNTELSREFSEHVANSLRSSAPQHCTAGTIIKQVQEFKRDDPDGFQFFLDHDFCKYVQKYKEFLESSGTDLEEIKVISPQGRHLKARAKHSSNSNISRVFRNPKKEKKDSELASYYSL